MPTAVSISTDVIRAIVGARVSDTHGDEGKTSHITQHEAAGRYATANFWEVIGSFEDLDVSAQVAPWERPDLGPWLTDRADEWDAIIWAKVDRAFRSIFDCVDVAKWAKANGKILVFTDDSIKLDYRPGHENDMGNQMAEIFLILASLFAAMELNRIKQRMKGAHTYLRKTNRWAGGQPPYGFKIVPREGGGKTLAIDEYSAGAVRLMGKLLLEGKSLWEIAAALDVAGFLTPANYVLQQQGENSRSKRKIKPEQNWNPTSIGKILRAPATMGLKTIGSGKTRKLARDDNGMPIRMAEGLFTEEVWARIQEKMDERTTKKERVHGASPQLGVAWCDNCEHKIYRQKQVNEKTGTVYSHYRCIKSVGKPACPGFIFEEVDVDRQIYVLVTDHLADVPVTVKRHIPGSDHTKELEAVSTAMSEVREEKDMGLYDYEGGEAEYKSRLQALAKRRKFLSAQPQRKAQWIEEQTGETYAEAYYRMTEEQRKALLTGAGIKVFFAPGEEPRIEVPSNLRKKLEKTELSEAA
ncbi:recombinase family protein [Kitasatospora sp. NPDC018619]|uniref:recombinase family protein n=1 Tax=unclassified Kitasatospora TaxID=2633591 RepID=UPI0037A996D3